MSNRRFYTPKTGRLWGALKLAVRHLRHDQTRAQDALRQDFLESIGPRVLRFSSDDVSRLILETVNP